ncbi:Uncharacterised protein [Mycobacteroides abscessus subsp. abscessus]|nr:Uncharacterised protein [Mycobacteroides abscessus subsp. abscessus]
MCLVSFGKVASFYKTVSIYKNKIILVKWMYFLFKKFHQSQIKNHKEAFCAG